MLGLDRLWRRGVRVKVAVTLALKSTCDSKITNPDDDYYDDDDDDDDDVCVCVCVIYAGRGSELG